MLQWLKSHTFCICLLFLAEIVLNYAIITKRGYTEIDWKAYMEEVEPFLSKGQTNYTLLNGNTGPLVYPAGFVYIYTALYHLTGQGLDIRAAQWIFAGLYLLCFLVVGQLYAMASHASKEWWKPFLTLGALCLSKRIHSIFVLRMFNDAVAMLLVYLAIYCFAKQYWRVGCTIFSVAFSVKMNIVLFAPGLLALLLAHHSLVGTLGLIAWCGVIQVALGLPFLVTDPWAYLSRSFNVGR